MENQKVHEYTVGVGPNGLPVAQLGKVHDLVTFIQGGSEKVHWLDGRWVDDGNHEIDPASVPETIREQKEHIPFKAIRNETDVLVSCQFCSHDCPSREYAAHLIEKHVTRGVGGTDVIAAALGETGAGKTVDPRLTVDDTEGTIRYTAEQLNIDPEAHVIDDEGFVVLNKDGSPRKRAGRPTKE